MGTEAALRAPLVQWGVAARAFPGEPVSGDRHLVQPFPLGVLIAVVDGLGHGTEAAAAADTAVRVLAEHADESIIPLVRRCHDALKRTRGVVLSLASFDARGATMTWLGVGNVEGVFFHGDGGSGLVRETLLQRGGVVGFQLPSLRAAVLPVSQGDLLLFLTDGIQSSFIQGIPLTAAPQLMADHLLARYGKTSDDALILVARYLGGGP